MLAKISSPRLFAVTPRQRLFNVLDSMRSIHPAIWIGGPPGAGKTALVASYLETLEQAAIWYQVDDGDNDPAAFFHYFGLAGQKAVGRKRIRLPILTPEYLADLPGFTRGFFRALFSKLPASALLILDNYHELSSESDLHGIIRCAIAECPVGSSFIVISHEEPPSQFSRELANNLVGQIRWDDLRLTLDETSHFAAGIQGLDQIALHTLHEEANGWAAGIVLMLERYKETGLINSFSQRDTLASVFNYFAGQIFDQAPAELREFLMRTALLPRMTTSAAEQISGNARAGYLLADLYRRRLFTDRLAEDVVNYQYHGLFRQFLLDRSTKHFSGRELNDLRKLAADICISVRQLDAAAKLYAEGEEWRLLIELICQNSAMLLAQGRHQTLQTLISLLPLSKIEMRWPRNNRHVD